MSDFNDFIQYGGSSANGGSQNNTPIYDVEVSDRRMEPVAQFQANHSIVSSSAGSLFPLAPSASIYGPLSANSVSGLHPAAVGLAAPPHDAGLTTGHSVHTVCDMHATHMQSSLDYQQQQLLLLLQQQMLMQQQHQMQQPTQQQHMHQLTQQQHMHQLTQQQHMHQLTQQQQMQHWQMQQQQTQQPQMQQFHYMQQQQGHTQPSASQQPQQQLMTASFSSQTATDGSKLEKTESKPKFRKEDFSRKVKGADAFSQLDAFKVAAKKDIEQKKVADRPIAMPTGHPFALGGSIAYGGFAGMLGALDQPAVASEHFVATAASQGPYLAAELSWDQLSPRGLEMHNSSAFVNEAVITRFASAGTAQTVPAGLSVEPAGTLSVQPVHFFEAVENEAKAPGIVGAGAFRTVSDGDPQAGNALSAFHTSATMSSSVVTPAAKTRDDFEDFVAYRAPEEATQNPAIVVVSPAAKKSHIHGKTVAVAQSKLQKKPASTRKVEIIFKKYLDSDSTGSLVAPNHVETIDREVNRRANGVGEQAHHLLSLMPKPGETLIVSNGDSSDFGDFQSPNLLTTAVPSRTVAASLAFGPPEAPRPRILNDAAAGQLKSMSDSRNDHAGIMPAESLHAALAPVVKHNKNAKEDCVLGAHQQQSEADDLPGDVDDFAGFQSFATRPSSELGQEHASLPPPRSSALSHPKQSGKAADWTALADMSEFSVAPSIVDISFPSHQSHTDIEGNRSADILDAPVPLGSTSANVDEDFADFASFGGDGSASNSVQTSVLPMGPAVVLGSPSLSSDWFEEAVPAELALPFQNASTVFGNDLDAADSGWGSFLGPASTVTMEQPSEGHPLFWFDHGSNATSNGTVSEMHDGAEAVAIESMALSVVTERDEGVLGLDIISWPEASNALPSVSKLHASGDSNQQGQSDFEPCAAPLDPLPELLNLQVSDVSEKEMSGFTSPCERARNLKQLDLSKKPNIGRVATQSESEGYSDSGFSPPPLDVDEDSDAYDYDIAFGNFSVFNGKGSNASDNRCSPLALTDNTRTKQLPSALNSVNTAQRLSPPLWDSPGSHNIVDEKNGQDTARVSLFSETSAALSVSQQERGTGLRTQAKETFEQSPGAADSSDAGERAQLSSSNDELHERPTCSEAVQSALPIFNWLQTELHDLKDHEQLVRSLEYLDAPPHLGAAAAGSEVLSVSLTEQPGIIEDENRDKAQVWPHTDLHELSVQTCASQVPADYKCNVNDSSVAASGIPTQDFYHQTVLVSGGLPKGGVGEPVCAIDGDNEGEGWSFGAVPPPVGGDFDAESDEDEWDFGKAAALCVDSASNHGEGVDTHHDEWEELHAAKVLAESDTNDGEGFDDWAAGWRRAPGTSGARDHELFSGGSGAFANPILESSGEGEVDDDWAFSAAPPFPVTSASINSGGDADDHDRDWMFREMAPAISDGATVDDTMDNEWVFQSSRGDKVSAPASTSAVDPSTSQSSVLFSETLTKVPLETTIRLLQIAFTASSAVTQQLSAPAASVLPSSLDSVLKAYRLWQRLCDLDSNGGALLSIAWSSCVCCRRMLETLPLGAATAATVGAVKGTSGTRLTRTAERNELGSRGLLVPLTPAPLRSAAGTPAVDSSSDRPVTSGGMSHDSDWMFAAPVAPEPGAGNSAPLNIDLDFFESQTSYSTSGSSKSSGPTDGALSSALRPQVIDLSFFEAPALIGPSSVAGSTTGNLHFIHTG